MGEYIKILRPDLTAFHDNTFKWKRRGITRVADAEPNGPCGKGLHLARTVDDGFRYAKFPCRIFEVEPVGPVLGEDETKIRVAAAKLGKEVVLDYVNRVNDFVDSIQTIPWYKGIESPLPDWKMFNTWASSWAAARATTGAAARATTRATTGATARATTRATTGATTWAARVAARDAARAAARDAARAARAAWDAAWDGILMASILVCDNLSEEHTIHARARWEVWRRGYGLLCDIDGTLYCYRKP